MFTHLRPEPWRDPAITFEPHAERDFALLLLSDGGASGRWSYIALDPDRAERLDADDERDGFAVLRDLRGRQAPGAPQGPPFQGGVAGLIAYEYASRLEPVVLERHPAWPDLQLARYPAVLAFDHRERRLIAVGRGGDEEAARAQAARATGWLKMIPAERGRRPSRGPLAARFALERPSRSYEAAVADVVARIRQGEIFQANIAQTWSGRLAEGAGPFEVFRRLVAASPAPFCAYFRLPGLALVSHSPERFIRVAEDGVAVESRPIKGTRRRGGDALADDRLRAELLASAKDRAENLMIVDLMRNDLSRVCAPGTVKTPELFAVESYSAVHHLVSTIAGRLAQGRDAVDLLAAAFPPGSITGAPKVQAMKVIAGHERGRGPWCGSLFWAGFDGGLDSSVLIRTAGFVQDAEGWWFRASAGAGIVADSDPAGERAETEAKIEGLRRALTETP